MVPLNVAVGHLLALVILSPWGVYSYILVDKVLGL